MAARDPRFSWCEAGAQREVTASWALRRIERLARVVDADVNIVDPRGQILQLLLQENRALVMRLREAGDPGKVASSPSGAKPPWRFMLSNGQLDVYPDRQTVPRDVGLKLVEDFVNGVEMVDHGGVRWT